MDNEVGISEIRKLNEVINSKHRFNFSDYAQSSFKRRIERVLQLHNFKSVTDLIERLETDEKYFNTFLDEITVNTTEMFRDPGFWKILKEKVLPTVADYKTIRIWHAGCSSGEEVFTMAIVLKELGLLDKSKLYATDINMNVIEKAKSGKYSVRNTETNEMNYEAYGGEVKNFRNYYTKKGTYDIQMNLDLLKNTSFSVQNLITLNQPFMKFDIILCRNVMIYFNANLQEKVFKLFHESLLDKGYLGIGSKESLIWSKNAGDYDVINNEEKIFRKK